MKNNNLEYYETSTGEDRFFIHNTDDDTWKEIGIIEDNHGNPSKTETDIDELEIHLQELNIVKVSKNDFDKDIEVLLY